MIQNNAKLSSRFSLLSFETTSNEADGMCANILDEVKTMSLE